jgi:hypothetical protein
MAVDLPGTSMILKLFPAMRSADFVIMEMGTLRRILAR